MNNNNVNNISEMNNNNVNNISEMNNNNVKPNGIPLRSDTPLCVICFSSYGPGDGLN